MWLKLCRNDFLRVSDRPNRCIESPSACFESPYVETTVNSYIYSTLSGETSRGLMYSFKACRGNCMHRRTCVVSKCVVVWKTVPFHDQKLMKNTLYIPESIPSHTETRKSDKGFLRKITDFRDYCLFVCLFVIVWRVPLIERAERTDWINVRCINSAILRRKWRLYKTNNKTFHY